MKNLPERLRVMEDIMRWSGTGRVRVVEGVERLNEEEAVSRISR
jgi:hypothetical protein